MPRIRTSITIEWTHAFAGAWEMAAFSDVSYLALTHHHFGRATVEMAVYHDDREVELHQFRRWLLSLYPGQPNQFGNMSCEAVARDLHSKVFDRYPSRPMTIRVDEDEWVGVVLEFDAKGEEV